MIQKYFRFILWSSVNIYFIHNLLKCKNWPITKSIYDAYRIDDRNNSTNEVMKRIYGKLQIKLLISKC